jgi:hypothetical protein
MYIQLATCADAGGVPAHRPDTTRTAPVTASA